MEAMSPDRVVSVAADWVKEAVNMLPESKALEVEVIPRPVPVVKAPVVNEKLVPVASSEVAASSPEDIVRSPSVKVMAPRVIAKALVPSAKPCPAMVTAPETPATSK